MFRLPPVILALLSLPLAAVELRVATYNIGAYFNENGNAIYGLGDPGTPDHDRVAQVLARVDADVVALQEVHGADVSGSPDDLDALAATVGYPYVYVAPVQQSLAFDTTLRVAFLSRYPLAQTGYVGSPAGAKEITRLHPVVKVDVPGTQADPVLISVHLKSGTATSDRFRRAVELRRLSDYLVAQGYTGDDNVVVLGDFNPSSTATTFEALPSGLPSTFALGNDLSFPISYSPNPLLTLTQPAMVRLDPRQVNGSASTFGSTFNNGPVLDLILVTPGLAARGVASEVYHSARDGAGVGLPKAGSPPAAEASAEASDHLLVFADLQLDEERPDLVVEASSSQWIEGGPGGMLTVRIPQAKASPVTVALQVEPGGGVTLAASSVVIPAGQTAAQVGYQVPRNFVTEGSTTVAVRATASGYDDGVRSALRTDADGEYWWTDSKLLLRETFEGFGGGAAPGTWTASGGVWRGVDEGNGTAEGFRSYRVGSQGAVGYLGSEMGEMRVLVRNARTRRLETVDLGYLAKMGRPVEGGAVDRLRVGYMEGGEWVEISALAWEAGVAEGWKRARVGGLAIEPGGALELVLRWEPEPGLRAADDVWVNEIHYDNVGIDVDEFVEIAAGPDAVANLSEYQLILYNGDNGLVVGTHPLSGFTEGQTTASGHRLYSKPIPGLQNGPAEGLALVRGSQLLRWISYEGSVTGQQGVTLGLASQDIGVSQASVEAAGTGAIGLRGSGTVEADFQWFRASGIPHSPGLPNQGQTFVAPVRHQGLAVEEIEFGWVDDADGDGLVDALDPDDDNDGQTDVDEKLFGTDPVDARSFYRWGWASAGTLRYPTLEGRSYRLERSDNLEDWVTVREDAGTGEEMAVEAGTAGGRRFYRLVVTPEP